MRVTVIGEKCLDVFIYGDCKRLSPEAPVPVFNPTNTITNFGMAGNVVENVKSLKAESKTVGLHQSTEIKKTRYVDKKTNHMLLRVDENDFSEPIYWNISSTNLIQNSDIVIVSDYDKGFLGLEDLNKIAKLSKLSILDSKKILTENIINLFSFVKLNESEFKQNQHLSKFKNIIVTLGAKGAMYDGEIFDSPSPKETIDVSGAGDTFTASFILKYFEAQDIRNSLIFANEMSSLVVSKRGVATPRL